MSGKDSKKKNIAKSGNERNTVQRYKHPSNKRILPLKEKKSQDPEMLCPSHIVFVLLNLFDSYV